MDGDDWRDIHRSIFGIKPKIANCYPSFNELEEWFSQAEMGGAKKFALSRLALKSYPSSELRKALHRVMVRESTIEKVLLECVERGYVDDQDWMTRFIKHQVNRKAGPLLIAAKLRSKGITEEEISKAFRENQPMLSGSSQIVSLIQRRYSKEDLADFRTRRKVFAALMRKGFHPQEILETLDNYSYKGISDESKNRESFSNF